MMKRLFLLSWLLATLISTDLISQSKAELKNDFHDAESWILFEGYNDALPLYQKLLKAYPDNSNYKYRIGQCYLNIPGEKAKAISYLEDAVKSIRPAYREGKFRETAAPYDALYYLANAYRINYQLDKAVETYQLFRKRLDPKVYDTTIVKLQIQSCYNARELMEVPVFVKETNLGKNINGSGTEFNPVVSDNEDLIIFSQSQVFYDAILSSRKIDGIWSEPVNMNEVLKVDKEIFPTSLSKDGKTLYLYNSADYDGDIYTTRFENGKWSPIVKLNQNINTKFWESHATISHDNNKLYFTSNRKGTLGGLDIYVSKRDSTGDWGMASNLGPVINTPYNEESPFLSRDDRTLFFSSRGHFNMGGYDIFSSRLQDNGGWSDPVNIGYPLNTTDDDVFFNPMNVGYEGYYAKESPNGYGKQDILRIEIFSGNHPRHFFIKGMAKVADLIDIFRDSVKISTVNTRDPKKTIVVYTHPKTGDYDLQLPQGKYQITYEAQGGEKVVKPLDLPVTYPRDTIMLPGVILPRTDFVADLSVESNKSILVNRGDSIPLTVRVEPKSILTIEHWAGKSLLSSKQYTMTDSILNFKIGPGIGDNKIIFNLTDRFNNKATADVSITRGKNTTGQPLIRPEYKSVLSDKQMAAFIALLRSRSNDKLLRLINESKIDKQRFEKVDDPIIYLKGEAAGKNITAEEIDKLALRVGLMDNILTQAAVDIMAKYTDGFLKRILSDLNIYRSNLKTWKDLQAYISSMTGGKVSPEDLNKIAEYILADYDPSILILREKILVYSKNSPDGNILRQSVAMVDTSYIKTREKWLQAIFNQSVSKGLTLPKLSEMAVILSSLPGTKVEQYLRDLIEQSAEPVTSALKSLDLKKEFIKTPKDLLLFLLTNKDKVKYPEEGVYLSIANIIIAKNIPSETIAAQLLTGNENRLWILWILLGTAPVFLLFGLWKRRRDKKK